MQESQVPGPVADFWKAATALPSVGYAVDAWQRNILFVDILRQRGNQYLEHRAQKAPNVLLFEHELVLDGRTLPRPVNYGLVRVLPPPGQEIDPAKRPIIVVDPRAGHGPGIGGFKADSEIGMGLRAGHPCYFIGFLPVPVRGQTIEDVIAAEAAFIRAVVARHPDAREQPFVIGNCQAGWQILMVDALHPELFGPVLVAGAPVSYWAGERGGPAMRYMGGMLGGTWLTAFLSDLGNGRFDGGNLVANFESNNPANTFWTKQYQLWSQIDTEGPRYLGFERWWNGHVELEGDEIQFITDELFVGNKLSSAEIITRNGDRIDLRDIKAPIVVFCSRGDDVTPPQQALGWVLDLYERDEDLVAHEQTIVYAVHPSIGHLGIFVSGKVAKKEHEAFADNIDLIDVLPPGLYEAVLVPCSDDLPGADLVTGDWILRLEPRTLADIRALGVNTPDEDRAFATVARVSEINLGLYRTFLQPWVKAWSNETTAELSRRLHPLRLSYELFSDQNPMTRPIARWAEEIRKDRTPPAAGQNPWTAWQGLMSDGVVAFWDGWKQMRDIAVENSFFAIYGSPALQSMVGMRAREGAARPEPGHDPAHRAYVRQRVDELRHRIAKGGAAEALLRALLYVGLRGGALDERHLALLRRIQEEHGKAVDIPLVKALLREQYGMLKLDEKAALAALPELLGREPEKLDVVHSAFRRIATVTGPLQAEREARFGEVDALFVQAKAAVAPPAMSPTEPAGPEEPEEELPTKPRAEGGEEPPLAAAASHERHPAKRRARSRS